MAVEHGPAPRAARLGVGWIVLLLVTIVAGVLLPPLGIGLAVIGATRAHIDGRQGLRNGFIALGAVFAVLTVVVGVFLVGVEGGGGVTKTP